MVAALIWSCCHTCQDTSLSIRSPLWIAEPCGPSISSAEGPAKQGDQLAARAKTFLDSKAYNSASSSAASAAQKYNRAAQCYASANLCTKAAAAAKSAASAYDIASDAAMTATSGVKGDLIHKVPFQSDPFQKVERQPVERCWQYSSTRSHRACRRALQHIM